MWKVNNNKEREYEGGKEDWEIVARFAKDCPGFIPDDEDEMVADEPVSCYNCRYRRWSQKSFLCCNSRVEL